MAERKIKLPIGEIEISGAEVPIIEMKQRADDLWWAWSLGVEVKTIRSLLDQSCSDAKEADGTLRDSLWLLTTEVWTKNKKPSLPK